MVRVSDIELPVVLKNKLLFSAGNWNNLDIKPEEIAKAYTNTMWDAKKVQSLFYEHQDTDAREWTGNVINPVLMGSDVFGDLEIWDANTAIKLDDGKAPFAISAKIHWSAEFADPVDFSFDNFSLVAEPGVQKEDIYINFNKSDSSKTAKFYSELKLNSDERRSNLNEKMENEKTNEANFSKEAFDALVARVSILETQAAKFSEESEEAEAPAVEAEEEATEEAVEEVEEAKEDEAEDVKEEAEEEATEEEAEEVEDEAEESVEEEATEEETEEVEEEATEKAEGTFSNEVVSQLKQIKDAIGKSAIPAASNKTKVAGFSAAILRLEKEF